MSLKALGVSEKTDGGETISRRGATWRAGGSQIRVNGEMSLAGG